MSHNRLQSYEDVEHLTEVPSITVLDVSNNRLNDPNIVNIFATMPNLHVLNLMGNPVIKDVRNYRKTLILRCTGLKYLDDRPVFPKERACAEAWQRGGVDAENEERMNWINKERRRIQKSVDYVAQIRKDADARKAKNKDEEQEEQGEGEEKKDGEVAHDEGLGDDEDEGVDSELESSYVSVSSLSENTTVDETTNTETTDQSDDDEAEKEVVSSNGEVKSEEKKDVDDVSVNPMFNAVQHAYGKQLQHTYNYGMPQQQQQQQQQDGNTQNMLENEKETDDFFKNLSKIHSMGFFNSNNIPDTTTREEP